MNDPKTTPREKARRAGAFALIGTLAACLVFALIIIVLGVKLHRQDALLADTQKQLAQGKTDGAKAQQELDKANTAAADLKSQLDKANAKSADIQAQLDLAKSASADLQTQVDIGKTRSADAQAQLDKSKAQSADLQNQVSQATAGSTQLLTQLDQAKIQSMDLQARLQKAEENIAQLQPMLMKTRHMPVTESFEKAYFGRGFTLHVNNLNQQPLSVSLTINSQGKARSQSNVIGGASTLNVENLAAGDTVAIASDGYDTANLTAQ